MRRMVLAIAFGAAACATASKDAKRMGPGSEDPVSADVQGMQVVVKYVPNAELVSGFLCVKGGVRNWGKDDAGIEALSMETVASGGTTTRDKVVFARNLAAMGSTIRARSTDDYSGLVAKSLAEHWDETFALLVDAFLHPALPREEIELQRQLMLSGLRHEQENPDGQLRLLVRKAMFQGHPYQNRSAGYLETVSALTPEQVAAYLGKVREKSRLLLVVVGAVPASHVVDQIKAAFASLPAGTFQAAPLPRPSFAKPGLATVERKLPTNYIDATFVGPGWRDPDFPAAWVAMNALGVRIWEEVRTKRNLSYAAFANLRTGGEVPLGELYVTAVDPNAAMKVMLDEARRLQNEPIPEAELTGHKSIFLTRYLMNEQTTDAQAEELVRAQIFAGDWRMARTLLDKARAVSPADVQAFARKYIGKLQMVVLGDPGKIDPQLFGSL